MQIKDIKSIVGSEKLDSIIASQDDHLLLLYNIVNNYFALFNVRDEVSFGYYKNKVYKGVTENNNIVNISVSNYYRITSTQLPPSYFIFYDKTIINKSDSKFLDIMKQTIIDEARRTTRRREILGI